MKNSKFLIMFFGALFISYLNQSCTEAEAVTPSEFIADSTTFVGYSSWQQFTETGINSTLGLSAHGGQDSTSVRDIYYKDSQSPENGTYPVGTVIYKHVTNPTGLDAHFAMVKRGSDFNPTNADWEWFILDATTGSVTTRGGVTMGCNGCHSAATTDYSFIK
ncbi:MAG: hypothetical protein ACI976_002478 [Aureispira sp.]|jgi:hypothetical protein